jgi:hypothetical protein
LTATGRRIFITNDKIVKDDTPMNSISKQLKFNSPILPVVGNADYNQYRAELNLMDDICQQSGIDEQVAEVILKMKQQRSDTARASKSLSPKLFSNAATIRIQENARILFRAALLRKNLGESLRVFCRNVADSPLRQLFCGINRFVAAEIFSKSRLAEFENDLPADFLRQAHTRLLQSACEAVDPATDLNPLGLESPISIGDCYADTTCMQANIHYPVDWILLRDVTRTLMLAVDLIRNSGLRHRMPCEPAEFISQINRLCIAMAQCRRKKDGRKYRKAVLRLMKKLLKKVSAHAERHAKLLEEHWPESDYTEFEAKQILIRIRRVLDRLPAAVCQAHERIIGERRVPNDRKILSIYEDDVHVIVRGKAGAETEFGNTLLLVEQADGLIVDWDLLQDGSPGDAALLADSLKRIDSILPGKIESFAADRGFDSPAVRELLATNKIYNVVCPRSVPAFAERLKEPEFRRHQKRRAQTEARIAILNGFAANPMLQKGFEHREIHMCLSVLAHNLRKLAQLRNAQANRPPNLAAA